MGKTHDIDPDVAHARAVMVNGLRWLDEDLAAEAAREVVRAKKRYLTRKAEAERETLRTEDASA
jgi:hypothetical protein